MVRSAPYLAPKTICKTATSNAHRHRYKATWAPTYLGTYCTYRHIFSLIMKTQRHDSKPKVFSQPSRLILDLS